MATPASRRLIVLCCAFLFVGLLLAGPTGAQPLFEPAPDYPLIVLSYYGRSFAVGDYDNDGWTDFFLADLDGSGRLGIQHHEGADRRVLQGGRLIFLEMADVFGETYPIYYGIGATFGDYDNDGDLDLFQPVGYDAHGRSMRNAPNLLLRNDRGRYVDVAREAGLTEELPTESGVWFDYDRDGHLDLWVTNGFVKTVEDVDPAAYNQLYRNQGDGTFTNVTEAARLQVLPKSGLGGVVGDFDDDGWPDLYVPVNLAPNRLFLNDRQGGFVDATSAEIADPGEANYALAGDIDNDGDLDLFQTASLTMGGNLRYRSLMLLNLGGALFLDVTEGVGLSVLREEQSQNNTLFDIDNDGDLDLMLEAYPYRLFLNEGNGLFADRTDRLEGAWRFVPTGDYDRDGFLDAWFLFTGASRATLCRNTGSANHWLRVELVGVESNRRGIGARLLVTTGGKTQLRELYNSTGGMEIDALVAHFGLGEYSRVDRLEIRWPSGQVDVLTAIPADQMIRVFEGREGYHVVHPTVWESISDSLVVGTPVDFKAGVRPALFEAGAEITAVTADLRALGGAAGVPLTDGGEGTYRLEPVPLTVDGAHGFRTLSVMIDQTTSLGAYWTKLTKSIVVSPAADAEIFADRVADDWTLVPISGVVLDRQADEIVYEGEVSLGLEAAAFTVKYQPDHPIDPVGYKSLRFAFHPGDATVGFRPAFNVVVNRNADRAVQLLGSDREGVGIDMDLKDWQVVEIPQVALGFALIEEINFLGNLRGTFYLDDLRLVTAAPPQPVTAVLEEHSSTLPESFTLHQNYPNPFNSSTVIRFALPTANDVELSIFNLAGQQVATLVEGARETGTYTVHWDGRDDSGRALASGVYLYRLRAGDGKQVETRKLLLLR